MTALRIPDPSLVVLLGPAGSGKSTLAHRLFAPDEILSSDAFRAAVSGDEADQSATSTAFALLHRAARRRMAEGRLTVIDATNLRTADRRPLLAMAAAAAVPAVAIVLDLPADVVATRNGARARVVDATVIDRHLDRMRTVTDAGPAALAAEGFAQVRFVTTPDALDDLAIERVPTVSR